MDGSTDISKIIGLIMENPDIIEKIKNLASGDNSSQESDGEQIEIQAPKSENTEITADAKSAAPESTAEVSATYKRQADKKRRSELLCALKPYVSKERSRAIDTMLSVIEVLDIMKER